jgi:PAP2 superfamily protein
MRPVRSGHTGRAPTAFEKIITKNSTLPVKPETWPSEYAIDLVARSAASVRDFDRVRPAAPRNGRRQALLSALKQVSFFTTFVLADGFCAFFLPGVFYPSALALLACLFYALMPPKSDYRLWGLYVLGFLVFASLTTVADETGIGVNPTAPVSVGVILSGRTMATWLQDHLYRPGHIGPLEIYCFLIYASFFCHYLVGLALWRLQPSRFRVYVPALLGTLFLGLFGYFVFPETPPWLASEQGSISHVVRITDLVAVRLGLGDAVETSSSLRVNLVAAMPSVHVALITVIALALYDLRRWTRILGLVYLFSMCFAVMYLGEHYLIDAVIGMLLATVVYRACERRFTVPGQPGDEPVGTGQLAAEMVPPD